MVIMSSPKKEFLFFIFENHILCKKNLLQIYIFTSLYDEGFSNNF